MGSLANPNTPLPQFQDSDVPLEPTRLRAGDTWNWTRSFPNYPSSTYTLSYILNSPTNRFVFPAGGITADPDGQDFDIQMTATQTSAVIAGTYDFVAILTGNTGTASAGQQVTLVLQSVTVDPNLAAANAPVDTRSFIKQTLDMIEAAIAGNASPAVQEYMINGRQVRRISPLDLEKLHSIYLNKYRAEQRARGEYAPRRQVVGVRFNVPA